MAGKLLHAKKAYFVLIPKTAGAPAALLLTQEAVVERVPLATARAGVIGTDAVAGVDTQGFTARARVTLYSSTTAKVWEEMFGTAEVLTAGEVSNYDDGVTNLFTDNNADSWLVNNKIDCIIMQLEQRIDRTKMGSIADITSQPGNHIIMIDAIIGGNVENIRFGQFNTSRLDLESNRWRRIVTPVSAPS
jgi:hypothetical protein